MLGIKWPAPPPNEEQAAMLRERIRQRSSIAVMAPRMLNAVAFAASVGALWRFAHWPRPVVAAMTALFFAQGMWVSAVADASPARRWSLAIGSAVIGGLFAAWLLS